MSLDMMQLLKAKLAQQQGQAQNTSPQQQLGTPASGMPATPPVTPGLPAGVGQPQSAMPAPLTSGANPAMVGGQNLTDPNTRKAMLIRQIATNLATNRSQNPAAAQAAMLPNR